jgi:hypothetical protein
MDTTQKRKRHSQKLMELTAVGQMLCKDLRRIAKRFKVKEPYSAFTAKLQVQDNAVSILTNIPYTTLSPDDPLIKAMSRDDPSIKIDPDKRVTVRISSVNQVRVEVRFDGTEWPIARMLMRRRHLGLFYNNIQKPERRKAFVNDLFVLIALRGAKANSEPR